MKYYCNPLNLPYKYQIHEKDGKPIANREAADPSMVLFKGRYYMFVSMTAGFYVSDDLLTWELHKLPDDLPAYDYAPDVGVIGDHLYFSASKIFTNCHFYKTADPVGGVFEKIEGSFPFWDPHLFADDDDRVYFYWGCSNKAPLYGVEMDPNTLKPKGEKRELIFADVETKGFERLGHDHSAAADGSPYVEGAWMNKRDDTYYLQYAVPGTEFNVYADGVYVSKSPLGPFTLAKNNPFSYKPGGFANGAGHGSTMKDNDGKLWHVSTTVISKNHLYERRVGLWKAGYDNDGDLFCDQRYGDWPMRTDALPWDKPDYMLLSYGKSVKVSSGANAAAITDENIKTWWKAADNASGQWAEIDLGKDYDVRAVQINFADDGEEVPLPQGMDYYSQYIRRVIDPTTHVTRWKLEGSIDSESWRVLTDKSTADTDLPHDLCVFESGVKLRYVRLTVVELPYGQAACVSGIRVFGKGDGPLPARTEGEKSTWQGALDMLVEWQTDSATGHNILWGYAPDKLYHSYIVFGKSNQKIGALVKDEPVYFRVDAFNEAGITEGDVIKAR